MLRMSKRQLTRQQRRRIRQKQESLTTVNDAQPLLKGLVLSCFGKQAEVEVLDENQAGSVYRCHLRANIETPVAGDEVLWREGHPTGVIETIAERRSLLSRPDKYHRLKPIASNIDQMVIVIAPEPRPFPRLIDRYLVAAHANTIQPVLFLNKIDQLDSSERFLQTQQLTHYRKLGYPLLQGAALQADTLTELRNQLKDKTSVLVGQSGVGKSSLINALLPSSRQRIGDLSETGKGSHTTTAAGLFHLPEGGRLIDSPGIREFGLWHLDAEKVIECFIEFRPYIGHCKFRNCTHGQENNCAIRQALAEEKILPARFQSYELIRSEMKAHSSHQAS
jgi:ribosome biogenesis GTPase